MIEDHLGLGLCEGRIVIGFFPGDMPAFECLKIDGVFFQVIIGDGFIEDPAEDIDLFPDGLWGPVGRDPGENEVFDCGRGDVMDPDLRTILEIGGKIVNIGLDALVGCGGLGGGDGPEKIQEIGGDPDGFDIPEAELFTGVLVIQVSLEFLGVVLIGDSQGEGFLMAIEIDGIVPDIALFVDGTHL